MSVRVHAIAKEVGMTSKELMAVLADRGYEIKSASSTIDNITAESLIEEFKAKQAEEAEAAAPEEAVSESTPEETPEEEQEEPASAEAESKVEDAVVEDEADSSAATPIVKSREDVERERLEKLEAEAREKEAASSPKPAPVPVPVAPPPPAVSKPAPVMAPPPPTAGKAGVPPPPPMAKAATVPAPPSSPAPSGSGADSEAAGVVEGNVVTVKPPIVVRDFAGLIGLKPFQLISELMEMGIFASMNQSIEEDVARQIAHAKGFELEVKHRGEKAEPGQPKKQKEEISEDDESLLEARPPVVCILGHVDHGKTTLLDTIRQANVVSGEAGGITQHVGAYQIERNDRKITFLDTPGHAAFSKIRERGANLTDVAVLVVAADDGFMPQTDEALKFAQRAQGTIVVAINKMDVKGADPDKVKTHMQERGIASEDWGGEIVTVPISALKGENVDELLDMILLQADLMELKANPKAVPEGVVVEARQEVGRGPTATIIVQKGTLKVGDSIVCGPVFCKVKAMIDDRGEKLKAAPPSTPVNVLGWSGAPRAGDSFRKVKNEREARNLAEDAAHEEKLLADSAGKEGGVDALFAAIAKTKSTIYKVILRSDVRGSAEALKASLEEIKSDKVSLEIVQSDVGQITKNDVSLAGMSGADVIGFNVKLENGVMGEAKHQGVNVFQNNIIYEIIDLVKDNMAELLEPELHEKKVGRAEVRQIFGLGKGREVAGSMVMEGSVRRHAHARLLRGEEILAEGRIDTLRRFKDDVTEVKAGFECGIRLEGFDSYEEGDAIETYEIEKIRPDL